MASSLWGTLAHELGRCRRARISCFPRSAPAREIMAALSFDQAVAWIGARLAEALDYAFTKDVAHGDVKPSNILLTADGSPMLLDFNLAATVRRSGQSTVLTTQAGPCLTWPPSAFRHLSQSTSLG